MIKNFKLFLQLSLLFFLALNVSAQNVNISDAQLMQIIVAANQRGMSQQEVAMYAKSKGYSDAEVSNMMQRANVINAGSSNLAGSSSLVSSFGQRQLVQFGNDDLMKNGTDSITQMKNEERKIFGYEVFHNNGISFTPNLNMATPKNYIVGPGDELIAQIYGIAQATINLKVSAEGKVVIPNVGIAHVGGLSIEAVKSLLTQKIGTRYAGVGGSNPSSFLMVTLSNIRTIKINIVGEVKKPGTYQLPSFTTSFNALYASGGPNVKGSFRNIQIFRDGKQIAEVDLYDFLIKGKTDKNIRLEDNDVLLVPQYGRRVEIVGEVRRNYFFEVKEKETVANLLDMANGFTNQAYRKIMTIQRQNGSEKIILNIDEKEHYTTGLLDGDYVIVGKLPNTYQNRIQIVGAVQRPGDYELSSKIKIKDLIDLAGGLNMDAFRTRAILYRTEKDLQKTAISIDLNKVLENEDFNNIQLNKEDLLVVSSIYDTKENYFVSIQGEVNQIGSFPYAKGMTVNELILQSKGFKEAASGSSIEIVRRVRDNSNEIAKILKVDINKDLSISANDKNTTLEPFDQVFVRASVGFREFKKVFVQGEAHYTGQFVIDRANMTVGDLVKRAGGLLPSANINGALLIRRTFFFKKDKTDDNNLNKLLELKVRYQDSTLSGFTQSNKAELANINKQINQLNLKKVKSEESNTDIVDVFSINNDNKQNGSLLAKERIKSEQENIEELKTTLQSRVFKNLRDVTVNEDQYQFVSIDLEKIMDPNFANKFDIQLQEGDILYIPTFNETVGVSGDVLYPVAVKYIPNTTLKKYVSQAGGFNYTALKRRAYVVEANGAVKRTHSFFGFKVYPIVSPGSQVFVPKNNKPKSNFSVDRVFGLVASLVTTYLLVKNL
jgi:protein involved in polysaccharide export with SLBB domain